MIKKIILKLKPTLINLLKKIENLEQSSVVSYKVKKIKRFSYPWWLFKFIFLAVLFFAFYLKSLEFGGIVFQFLILKMLSLAVIIFVLSLLSKIFLNNIRSLINFKKEDFEKDLILFWTLNLLSLITFLILYFLELNIYCFPISGLVLLVGLLMGIWWGGVFLFLNSIIGSFIYSSSDTNIFLYFLFLLLAGTYILTKLHKIQSRKDVLTVMLNSFLMNSVIIICLNIIFGKDLSNFFVFSIKNFYSLENINFLKLIINSFVGVFLSWLLFSVFSSPFELIYEKTTNIKLMELSNFNNPLLKKLMSEAPGTYHHSLIVSSLAENVALELQANPLLCKVAGYYHDIGKVVNPEYFIENQISIKNPHSEMNPSLSALVIVNHVKEGVKLAQKFNLDKVIIDIIQQHHGNSVIYGLYDKNLEFSFLDKDVLRYPGPKPQTKEAAIIMICDSCEAACRSLQEPDPQKIKETVEHVINAKFVEGQFDETQLTLRDLYKISNIVTQMLISLYHLRTSQLGSKE